MRTKYTPGPWIDPLLHLDAFFSDGKSTTFDPREAYAEEKERAYIAQRGGNAPPKAVEAVRIGARKEFDEGSLVPLSKIIEDREAEIAAAGARHEEVMKQLGRELSALDSKINPVRNKGAKRDALNDRARESRLAYESEVRGILDRYRPAIESHPEEVARKAESRRKTQEMKAQMVAVSAPSTHQDLPLLLLEQPPADTTARCPVPGWLDRRRPQEHGGVSCRLLSGGSLRALWPCRIEPPHRPGM